MFSNPKFGRSAYVCAPWGKGDRPPRSCPFVGVAFSPVRSSIRWPPQKKKGHPQTPSAWEMPLLRDLSQSSARKGCGIVLGLKEGDVLHVKILLSAVSGGQLAVVARIVEEIVDHGLDVGTSFILLVISSPFITNLAGQFCLAFLFFSKNSKKPMRGCSAPHAAPVHLIFSTGSG